MNRNKTLRVAATIVVFAGIAAAAYAVMPSSRKVPVTPDTPVEAKFKAAGRGASLTVLPTRVAGATIPQVGDTIALLLEQRGMTNLETSANKFTPPENGDLPAIAKALGEFVKANPATTDYVMFADVLGSREKGVVEVRAVIVNRDGETVWKDSQKKGDGDFDQIKPREPLQCCVLIVERLRPTLNLNDAKHIAPPGKIAARWQKDTGIPDQAELDRMKQRAEEFRKSAGKSTLAVYPVRFGEEYSAESAKHIAALVNEKKLIKASAVGQGPQQRIAGSINEQKVLWSMANGLSDYVKKNPQDADYVLFADYAMKGPNAVGAVHIAVCNRHGELVIVDHENENGRDFKSVKPTNREDCDKLVLKRLQGYCK